MHYTCYIQGYPQWIRLQRRLYGIFAIQPRDRQISFRSSLQSHPLWVGLGKFCWRAESSEIEEKFKETIVTSILAMSIIIVLF